MDIFSVIALIGGLAFFLYGMNVLSRGLERMAGGKLESYLKKMTSNRVKCLLLGAGITAAIQSSSAVTVMLVGLVNSGIISISQSVGVIMGSNIGTTVTAWVLTMVGIESSNVWISLLKPENFSLIFAFVGVLLIIASKNARRRDIGSVLVGFAVLMYGMELMSSAVKPLAEMPAFTGLLTAFKNPILGVLAGLVITAVIQSSSASVGILQALALTGTVSWGAAIPIIMGQNIGTCVTSLISSIGVSKNAKKVAVVHITFNILGTVMCLSLYCLADALFDLSFADRPISAIGIAAVHTVFNVFTTAVLMPLSKQLERFANFVLSADREQKSENTGFLDRRLLATPSVAISECDNRATEMVSAAAESLGCAISLLDLYDERQADIIAQNESMLDRYEDELGTYLVQISSKHLSDADSLKVSKMLHAIGDFERMGDHSVNLLHTAQELHGKKLSFSEPAWDELTVLFGAIKEILRLTESAYRDNDIMTAIQIEPLEQTVDKLVAEIKNRHVHRLQSGECSIELGFILSDVLNNLERVSDHCSNVAVTVIELSHNSLDTHKYLSDIRAGSGEYKNIYDKFMLKYTL